MNREKIASGIIIIGCMLFVFLVFSPTLLAAGKTVTDTVTLSPLEEHVVSFKLHEGDPLTIAISVSSGSIDLLIYDSENYISQYYIEEYFSDITTSFNTEFVPTWTDTFYVVFYNPNTLNSATFSYTLEHEQEFSSNLIINLSIGAGLLGSILIFNFIGKKENIIK